MTIPADRFLIFAGIIAVALVLLAVGIVVAMRGRKPSVEKSPVDDKPAPEWVKNIAGAAGKTLTHADSTVPNAPTDAVVVLRDPVSQMWQIEIGGVRYPNLREIHDDRLAHKVLEALEGLQSFAGITRGVSAPAPVPASMPSAVAPNIPVIPPSVARVEPTILSAMTQSGAPSKPRNPAPPNSILDQIEKVVQRNLLKDPVLADRRIHVGAAADGSLLIEVDWDTYKSADEIADDTVRNLIKTSIQEWERTA
jgi:hypothetical protein